MHAPQVIMLCLVTAALVISIFVHGKPKTGTHNFFVDAITTALAQALMYWGGFYG